MRAVLLIITLIAAHPCTEAADLHRSITVDARSEIRVTPDEAVLEFSIHTRDASIIDAKRENDRTSVLLARALRKLSFDGETFRVTDFEARPQYEGESPRKRVGYSVERSFQIRTGDFTKIEAAIAAVIDTAGNSVEVHQLKFRVRDQRKHQTEARRLAMEYAREKASHLAKLNGMVLGPPSRISESVEEPDGSDRFSGFGGGGFTQIPSGSPSWHLVSQSSQLSKQAAPAEASDEEKQLLLSPGQVSLNATVYVTFDLVPEK